MSKHEYIPPDTPITRSTRKANMVGKWIAVWCGITTILGGVYFVATKSFDVNRSPERLNKLENEQRQQDDRTAVLEAQFARIDERLKAQQKQLDSIEGKIDKLKP